jgi:hypothetical protein
MANTCSTSRTASALPSSFARICSSRAPPSTIARASAIGSMPRARQTVVSMIG